MTKKDNIDTKIAVIANDVIYIKEEVRNIKHTLEGEYVTQDQFDPVKKIVYGLVTLILTAVVGALIGLVVLR
jgi:plastocyanin domain-containing protein